jgi:hypothetical protein
VWVQDKIKEKKSDVTLVQVGTCVSLQFIHIPYCDVTPERWNSPLLANGCLTRISSATDKKQNNGRTARHGEYSVRREVMKELVQSSFRGEPSFESSVYFKRVQ